jgi:hypothetical protein
MELSVTQVVPKSSRTVRMLVVADPSGTLERAAKRVSPMVSELKTVPDLASIPLFSSYEIVVANYEALNPEDRSRIKRFTTIHNSPTRLLLVAGETCRRDLPELFANHTLTNLIAVNGDEIDDLDFDATVRKLATRDIFGLHQYFATGVEPTVRQVTCTADKKTIIAEAESFATRVGIAPRLITLFCTVADECVSNALYNAPVDNFGSPRFAHMARSTEVALAPGEAVEVRFAFDGKRIGLSVTDPFGTLDPTRLLDYFAKCYRRGADQVDQKPGGAGLGLYQILESLSHFVVNIQRGKKTEMIGILKAHATYRDFATQHKSFNVFAVNS